MKPTRSNLARKRPVNLTLNENLVSQAKGMTANLSGLVDQLLAEYIAKQNSVHHEKVSTAGNAAQTWNAFNEKFGSFAKTVGEQGGGGRAGSKRSLELAFSSLKRHAKVLDDRYSNSLSNDINGLRWSDPGPPGY